MFALFDYSSLSYIVLALSSAVTNLSNKTLIFLDFQGPTIKFHDFPGLENYIPKFHDFPGFPRPVQTLTGTRQTNKIPILNDASPLSCPSASLILQHGNFIECKLQAAKGRNIYCCKPPTNQSIPFFGYLLHSL